MAQNYVQVEVLLITGTTFSAGNWIKKDDDPAGRQPSEIEQLQEAGAFLALELSEVPLPIDPRWSLTPHNFLSCQNFN
jgi:hypothetical protein